MHAEPELQVRVLTCTLIFVHACAFFCLLLSILVLERNPMVYMLVCGSMITHLCVGGVESH
jgi:hypothetical protein